MRSNLLDIVFWTAVLCCAIAQYFIIRAVVRPASTSPGDFSASALSSQASLPRASRWQEIGWAILPTVLLAAAFWFAWRNLHPTSGTASTATPVSTPVSAPIALRP